MKKKVKSSGKPDALPHHHDETSATINVGLHRVSSRVDADGSAEAMLSSSNNTSPLFTAAPPMTRTMSTPLQSSSIPLSRTKSNPFGGMSYTMRRVLSSRDDGQHHQNALLEQESEGLVSSRVKGIYNRGDVEIILDNDEHSLPPTNPPLLVRRKSSLSAYSIKKVFSKRQDDEWQSESETDSFCRGGGASLQGGYDLRQVHSTPLQGMENGYALQRAKTTGYEQQQQQQQSSLYEEERMYNPLSLVRSRLSSIGQKVSRGGKEEDGTDGEDDDDVSNNDELSFISESVESSSTNPSTIPNSQRKKKRRSKYFIYQILFAMMISAGIAGTGVYLLKAGGEGEGGGEAVSSVVAMVGEEEDGGNTSAVEDGTNRSSSVGEDVALKVAEVLSEDEIAVDGNGILVEGGDKVNDEVIVEDVATVEESNEASADDAISLSGVDVTDATPKLESTVTVSNVTNSTADGDETMETITIAANITADIVDQPIPATTTTTATAPPPLSDIVEESSETAADDILLSVAVDATPKLESAVSNVTNSTAELDVDEDETMETITIAANVTIDIVDKPILATTVAATTTTTPPPLSDTITTFYVMADAPYTDHERNNLMPQHIEELDDTVEFLVHLGDLQWAKVDKCREGAYDAASTIMQKSRIPTFILPGDNDINDCNSMIHGEEMWTKYFALFDKRYDHSLNVTRWGKLNESFSFIHKEVLYLGLNIIGGRPASSNEKRFRHSQHLERIRAIFNDQLDDFKVVVLLGHAEPGQFHFDFFRGDTGFISMMKETGKPTIHFHGDWHAYYEREAEYGVDNYMRISLDGESSAPPILVTIDTSKTNPVKFDRRSENLDVACCSKGWPRYDGKVVNTPRPN